MEVAASEVDFSRGDIRELPSAVLQMRLLVNDVAPRFSGSHTHFIYRIMFRFKYTARYLYILTI